MREGDLGRGEVVAKGERRELGRMAKEGEGDWNGVVKKREGHCGER